MAKTLSLNRKKRNFFFNKILKVGARIQTATLLNNTFFRFIFFLCVLFQASEFDSEIRTKSWSGEQTTKPPMAPNVACCSVSVERTVEKAIPNWTRLCFERLCGLIDFIFYAIFNFSNLYSRFDTNNQSSPLSSRTNGANWLLVKVSAYCCLIINDNDNKS